jgi:phage gp45-like
MSYNPANPNGQATMAASAPVVLASDEVVPVQVGMIEELMSALLNRLGPIGLAIDPPSGRLRVLIDPVGGAQSLPVTVSTVTTVTTVTGLTNIGGNSAAYDQWAQMQLMVSPLRAAIAVS